MNSTFNSAQRQCFSSCCSVNYSEEGEQVESEQCRFVLGRWPVHSRTENQFSLGHESCIYTATDDLGNIPGFSILDSYSSVGVTKRVNCRGWGVLGEGKASTSLMNLFIEKCQVATEGEFSGQGWLVGCNFFCAIRILSI